MIGVRTTYYQNDATLAMPSIAFNDGSRRTEYQYTVETELDTIELDRFDDQHGF
jgi:hypothetical protein